MSVQVQSNNLDVGEAPERQRRMSTMTIASIRSASSASTASMPRMLPPIEEFDQQQQHLRVMQVPNLQQPQSQQQQSNNEPQPQQKQQQPQSQTEPRGASTPMGLHDSNDFPILTTLESDLTESPTLPVCAECNAALLRSYEHCLGGSDALLPSPHAIDEEEHGTRKNPPPRYEVIENPIRPRPVYVVDDRDGIDRDRVLFAERAAGRHRLRDNLVRAGVSRAAAKHELGATAATAAKSRDDHASKTVPSFHRNAFSGAIFRQILNAKDKEMERLRAALYEKITHEDRIREEKDQLKEALQRSMTYYTNAEHWQEEEGEQLKLDIKHLKKEISSLMAQLISGAIEKDKLKKVIEEEGVKLEAKDVKYRKLEDDYSELKDRLHDQLKEYIIVNQVIDDLKEEAKRGSEQVQNKNAFLQAHLDRISVDYDAAAKEVLAGKDKITGLEMELREIVGQFETVCEGKADVERTNATLTEQLAKTSSKLADVEGHHAVSSMQNAQMTEELKEMTKLHIDTQYNYEGRISAIVRDLEKVTAEKEEVDAALKVVKKEKEKLQSALKEVTKSKDQLETQLRLAESKGEKDVKAKDVHVTMLQKEIAEVKVTNKSLAEVKDRLMSQLNDLRGILEREQSAHSMVAYECGEVKRVLAEKVATFEEQTSRLTAAKVNLNEDKKQLMETLKDVRETLKNRGEELQALVIEYNEHRNSTTKTKGELESQLKNAQEAYKQLAEQQNALKKKYTSLVTSSTHLNVAHKKITAEAAVLEKEKVDHLQEIERLQLVRTALEEDISRSELANIDVKKHLEGVLSRVGEMEFAMQQAATDATAEITALQQNIQQLHITIDGITAEKLKGDERLRIVILRYGQLQRDYDASQKLVLRESAARSAVELNIDEIRISYQNERKLRLESERMSTKLKRLSELSAEEKAEQARVRERKMAILDECLNREHRRLEEVAQIIQTAG